MFIYQIAIFIFKDKEFHIAMPYILHSGFWWWTKSLTSLKSLGTISPNSGYITPL